MVIDGLISPSQIRENLQYNYRVLKPTTSKYCPDLAFCEKARKDSCIDKAFKDCIPTFKENPASYFYKSVINLMGSRLENEKEKEAYLQLRKSFLVGSLAEEWEASAITVKAIISSVLRGDNFFRLLELNGMQEKQREKTEKEGKIWLAAH